MPQEGTILREEKRQTCGVWWGSLMRLLPSGVDCPSPKPWAWTGKGAPTFWLLSLLPNLEIGRQPGV